MFLCCAAVQLSPIQKHKVGAGILCPNLQHAYSHSELYEKSGIEIQPEHYKNTCLISLLVVLFYRQLRCTESTEDKPPLSFTLITSKA